MVYRNVSCPACHAIIGSPCKGKAASGTFHPERIQRWAREQPKPTRPKKRKKAKPKRTRDHLHGSLPPEDFRILCEGLSACGVRSLAQYWKTPHWQGMIGLFERQQEIAKACVICGSHRYILHHRSYKRLGAEWMTDLVPLCEDHHRATHELLMAREPGVTLWNAHTKL